MMMSVEDNVVFPLANIPQVSFVGWNAQYFILFKEEQPTRRLALFRFI